MSTQAVLADVLLREAGHDGLWEWAMEQRKSVRPPSWDEVARRLSDVTSGQIKVGAQMLRKWVLAAEAEQAKGAAK